MMNHRFLLNTQKIATPPTTAPMHVTVNPIDLTTFERVIDAPIVFATLLAAFAASPASVVFLPVTVTISSPFESLFFLISEIFRFCVTECKSKP